MKVLRLTLAALLLSAVMATAQTVYRGDINLIDNAAGSSQFCVGGVDIVKSMVFPFTDSLAANSNTLAVVTLPRAILVQQIDVWVKTAFLAGGADSSADVHFRNTGTTASATLDSGDTYLSTNMTDVAFASGTVCSLLTTDDGGTCTGGIGGVITVWYTDN